MHGNPNLLPLQRSSSNEDYRYGNIYFSYSFHLNILLISDYYAAAARGRPPSNSGTPSYEMQGKINSFQK
jgi:hypothetical protein